MGQSQAAFPSALSYDHGTNPLPSFAAQADEKWFRVVGSHNGIKVQRHDILCQKDSIGAFFGKVAKRFGLKKKEIKQMRLKYQIKVRGSDEMEEHVILNDEDVVPTLKLAYSMCPEFYEFQLYVQSSKPPSRNKRRSEANVSAMKGFMIVNKQYYKAMSIDTAKKYLKITAYLRYLMGLEDKTLNNLINPSLYICHVVLCKGDVHLGDSMNLTPVVTHWKNHYGGSKSEDSCKTLVRRHNYLTEVKGASAWSDIFYYQDEDLEECNGSANKSLAIKPLMANAFHPSIGMSFKNSSLMVSLDVVEKIANCDLTALDGIDEERSITSHFHQEEGGPSV